MNLTVRDILSLGGLRDASIVAGNGGVNNIVDSISVLEVADSNISKWVLKNELYITSFYAIHTNIEKQKEVIRALHKSGGCGLVLCHIDMWIKDIDKEIIELCNTIDFPLIVANSEVSYVEILNPIIEKLMKINIDNFQLLLSTQNKLIEQVANKEELEDIFNNISSMFEQEILFLDLDNNCIFSKNADKNTIKTVEDYLRLNFNTINSECDKFNYCIKNIGQKKKVLYPIKTIGKFYGFVVVGYEEERFEHTLRKIENIAKICTLIYTKKVESKN
ncbi:PucR family transcriptional regulator ligand-binding domain-containing protein [Tissierella carlieri]|uniref:PucR family transcriptional regulator ligand-binding domain-containing protein n=1 Tax=Tissierella carlieri TaxID=689904 RepID=UPI003864960D